MRNLAIIDLNAGERLLLRHYPSNSFSLDLLQVTGEETGRIELTFPVSVVALTAVHGALVGAQFQKIDLADSRALVVVPRTGRAAVLVLMTDETTFRMLRLGAMQRRRLVVACEHARAAAGDRSFLAEVLRDAAVAEATVLE